MIEYLCNNLTDNIKSANIMSDKNSLGGLIMNGLVIVLIAMVVLILAYALYGRWLAKTWGIDEKAKTPAYTKEDGQDYIPSPLSAVFSTFAKSTSDTGLPFSNASTIAVRSR